MTRLDKRPTNHSESEKSVNPTYKFRNYVSKLHSMNRFSYNSSYCIKDDFTNEHFAIDENAYFAFPCQHLPFNFFLLSLEKTTPLSRNTLHSPREKDVEENVSFNNLQFTAPIVVRSRVHATMNNLFFMS